MHGVKPQVDRREVDHRRPNDRAELLEAARLEAGAELAEEDLTALLGVGRHVDDVDVLAVGQADCWRGCRVLSEGEY